MDALKPEREERVIEDSRKVLKKEPTTKQRVTKGSSDIKLSGLVTNESILKNKVTNKTETETNNMACVESKRVHSASLFNSTCNNTSLMYLLVIHQYFPFVILCIG